MIPILLQAEGLRDIVGPIEEPQGFPWLILLAALLGIIAGACVAALVLRKKKPQPTPRQIALAELDALQGETICAEATDILRRYLTAQLNLPATSRTTPEFLQIAKNQPEISSETTAHIERILELADQEKFARISFGQEERAEIITQVRQVINGHLETSQPEEVPA